MEDGHLDPRTDGRNEARSGPVETASLRMISSEKLDTLYS
jgi:hypothetical protein